MGFRNSDLEKRCEESQGASGKGSRAVKISRIEVHAPEREANSQWEGVVSGNQGGVWGTERAHDPFLAPREENKRRTLQKNDIAAAITRTDIFDFLVDIVPREEIIEEEGGGFGLVGDNTVGGVPYYYPPIGQPAVGPGMYMQPPPSRRGSRCGRRGRGMMGRTVVEGVVGRGILMGKGGRIRVGLAPKFPPTPPPVDLDLSSSSTVKFSVAVLILIQVSRFFQVLEYMSVFCCFSFFYFL
ncbi:hypothetical protein C3L33_14461, partial [Rhododendron williamsianum]